MELPDRVLITMLRDNSQFVTLDIRSMKSDPTVDEIVALAETFRLQSKGDWRLQTSFLLICITCRRTFMSHPGTCVPDQNLLGARRIPDPTTAGDFCRRFSPVHIEMLQDIFNDVRRRAWSRQPAEFFRRATIDMDGTLVATSGECKQGMDISHKGVWGFHPLVVSLAETGEVLRIVNRSGNRTSHEGAAT